MALSPGASNAPMLRSSVGSGPVKRMATRALSSGLALAAFLVLAQGTYRSLGLALAAATVAAVWAERWVRPNTNPLPELVLAAAGVLVGYGAGLSPRPDWGLVLTGTVLLGLMLIEHPVGEACALRTRTAHLGVRSSYPVAVVDRLGTANLVLLGWLILSALLRLPPWTVLAPTVAVGVVCVGALAVMVRDKLRPPAGPSRVREALERLDPTFLVHFSAPPGSEYQIGMWLPHLDRIGRPYAVLVREREHLAPIAGDTTAPVLYCPTLAALDEAIVPSVRTVFYVNHGAKNTQCVRFDQLTHVQIHHGDSEKALNPTPVSAMFDKIFVAGQAAIDRYERAGTGIPREKFAIVGRPQVASVEVTSRHVGEVPRKVVLYTPTWTGHFADSDYCSLPVAGPLVRELLAREAVVILRDHPYTSKNPESARQLAQLCELLAADRARTGREHLWGRAARAPSLVECINRSHALVSDVSSVVTDFLYSGKPYAIVDTTGIGDSYPIATAGYVLRADMSNVDKVVDELLENDPLYEARRSMRTYYLGDFPPDSYADAFVKEARKYC